MTGSRYRWKGILVWSALLGLGCDTPGTDAIEEASTRVEVRLPGGLEVSLDPEGPAQAFGEGDRRGWLMDDGTRLIVQAFADEAIPEGERTAASVAVAMAERLELGEAEGELSHHPCRAGTLPGECVDGWITTDDGDTWTRRGVVLAADGHFVWVDVAATSAALADAHAAIVRGSILLVDAGR